VIELSINKNDIARINTLLEDLSPRKQGGAIEQGIKKASGTVLKALVANVSGIVLKRRTGNLARSMGFKLYRKGGVPESVIGSGASLETERMKYANILETGGTIRPVNKQWLTIPTDYAKTSSGVPRFTAQELRRGAGGYNGSVIIDGIIYGYIGQKKQTKLVPLFILKKSVTIPAKSYMAITVDMTAGQVVEDIVNKIREVKENAK
jgi:hypothetical protein